MKTTDFTTTVTADTLNESMFKKFGSKVNFNKYTREELENYRNLLRTKINQQESQSNFNDLLTNEDYQKDKHLATLLNTRIKEMLGESILVMEKAVSKAQQQAAGVALAAKRSGKQPAGKGASAEMAKMSTKELEKFAGTKHKGLPKKVAEGEKTEGNAFGAAVRKAKADGIQKGEKVKVGGKEYPVKETSHQEKTTMKHVKNPTAGEKKAAKDIKPGIAGYKDRVAMLKSAEADGRLKKDESVEEGFPTVADAKARHEKEKTTGKFDKKDVGTGTQYTRKSSTFDNGTEDKPKDKKVKEGSKNLPGNQEKIDADHDGKIEKSDFAKLRAGKKKMKESQHKQNVKVVNENVLRLLSEDEEGKAKTITAGADMVNDFTSWMTRIGQYQTKSMIELADTIRANFGQNESEQFKSAVAPALETALNTLTQAREEISNAVAVLAGEAQAETPMGGDMGGNMDMSGNEEIPGADMDSMNTSDEFGASDAAAGGAEISGRTQRESRTLFARKLSEAHSIIGRLAK